MSSAHDDHGDSHGHGHGGSRFIQHHYDDAQHQFDSGKLGIWFFLAQEVLFFSALFVAYILYRNHRPEIFGYAHRYLDVKWGAINTAVLICSSLTAAWAVRCAQLGQKKRLIGCILYRVHHPEIYGYAHKWLDVKYGAINTAVLIFSSLTAAWAVRAAQLGQRLLLIVCITVTILCALTFLSIKYIEYAHKYHEQILFGRYFDPCVSPGGEELITKKQDCPGTRSSVDFDKDRRTGKANSGCFEMSKIDQDPDELGVQADCQVDEVKLQLDAKGEPVKGPDGKDIELSRRSITAHCKDELLEVLSGEAAARAEGGEKHEAAPQYPCWRPSYQPAVCVDLTDVDKRAHGAASRPQVGILVEYGDHEERGEDLKIAATCKDVAPKPVPAPGAPSTGPPATPKLGQAAIHPVHIPTTHEEHEIESLGPPPEHTSMFLTVYFAMTGLHGIHVLVGVFVFVWLLWRSIRGDFTPDYFGPIDYAALYWHIVDLIWIFLFPLLYLIK
jgi:heme/copper-type cytochrome/quinol oxidase subunit 3